MPISFAPMREYMRTHNISYYYLANQGIEPATLQRIRRDQPVTTVTLGKLGKIMGCAPENLICYQESDEE